MESKKAELRQQIYNELKQKVISGAFVCNQRLVETQIAAQYGVNKANIHEILLTLQKDELVRYEPMKGFFVQEIFSRSQKFVRYWKTPFLKTFSSMPRRMMLTPPSC